MQLFIKLSESIASCPHRCFKTNCVFIAHGGCSQGLLRPGSTRAHRLRWVLSGSTASWQYPCCVRTYCFLIDYSGCFRDLLFPGRIGHSGPIVSSLLTVGAFRIYCVLAVHVLLKDLLCPSCLLRMLSGSIAFCPQQCLRIYCVLRLMAVYFDPLRPDRIRDA